MRFLKKKIARAAQAKENKLLIIEDEQTPETSPSLDLADNTPFKNEKVDSQDIKKRDSTKTIVKNYGKAIASFAMNKISKSYLMPLLKQEGIKLKDFVDYMSTAKESIEGIETFRALLLIQPPDETKEAKYKRIFQKMAEIFIKYFSVNWIFSGRMHNKQAHLKCRFKILRRIRNPECFTYLK